MPARFARITIVPSQWPRSRHPNHGKGRRDGNDVVIALGAGRAPLSSPPLPISKASNAVRRGLVTDAALWPYSGMPCPLPG